MNRIIDLPAQKPENPIVQDDRSQSCKYRRPIARAEQIAYCHHADQDDERHDISQQTATAPVRRVIATVTLSPGRYVAAAGVRISTIFCPVSPKPQASRALQPPQAP